MSQVSFLSAFAEYVQEHLHGIGTIWMRRVRESADIPIAASITQKELEDHVPALMDELIAQLRGDGGNSLEPAAELSRIHGSLKWKAGFNPSHLMWEIYIIRRVLTNSVLSDFLRDHPEYSDGESREAESLMHDFFHRLTCDSVGQLIEEQQRIIQDRNLLLEQTNEARERLTRTVSHELRNVLNALTLGAHLLVEEGDEAQRQQIIRRSLAMMSDMRRLLNDLLDYSTLMAGRSSLSLEELSLPELFREITAQWRPVAEEQGLTFQANIDPELGAMFSDRMKIKQIAGNLLSNAIKYRKPAPAGLVRLCMEGRGEHEWELIVSDNGIGISPADLKTLFGEFIRVQPGGPVSGTGLGLAICKEFAELLGGHIVVESSEEEGSLFQTVLPRKSQFHLNGASREA